MSKPTDGEWIAHGNAIDATTGDDTMRIGLALCVDRMTAETDTNARLFAASKELLDSLEFAYAYLKCEGGGREWAAGLERMRAAIAKARGED